MMRAKSLCLVTFFLVAACTDDVVTYPVTTTTSGSGGAGQGGTTTSSGGNGQGGDTTSSGGSTAQSGGGTQGGVPCPDMPCNPGEICCVTPDPGNTLYECVDANGTCNGFLVGCDGPEDCPGGTCCSDGVTSSCVNGGTCDPGSSNVCHHTDDCGPMETCCGGHGGSPVCMLPQGQLCVEACLDVSDCEPNEFCCPASIEKLCGQTPCQ